MITVRTADPREEQATALLRESHALMQSLFPPEDNYYLEIDDLRAPDIRFFVAEQDGEIVGTGALAIREGYGEVKSMFVAESARGRGVADQILTNIETAANEAGLSELKLETGNVLHAAHALYRRHGFTECGPFGSYGKAGSSVFMEKPL